jgi:hypothetical protein
MSLSKYSFIRPKSFMSNLTSKNVNDRKIRLLDDPQFNILKSKNSVNHITTFIRPNVELSPFSSNNNNIFYNKYNSIIKNV